jgi:hypothetical protein
VKNRKPKTSLDVCSSCGNSGPCERHHLLAQVDHGPDTPTVPLCGHCHGLVHSMKKRPNNLGELIKRGRLKSARERLKLALHEEMALETETMLLRALEAINKSIREEYRLALESVDVAYDWLVSDAASPPPSSDVVQLYIGLLKEELSGKREPSAAVQNGRTELARLHSEYIGAIVS